MTTSRTIVEFIEKLIRDGYAIYYQTHGGDIRDMESLLRWSNELILLQIIRGNMVSPWSQRLAHNGVDTRNQSVLGPLAALETIKHAIDNGLLTSYRDLIIAEEFAHLHEQGSHLLSQGYFLAAGVIFRAVLEEKLRELCRSNACMPDKQYPTINDLNQALYKCEAVSYDKGMMLNVTALAAVGNNAAHNAGDLKREDVERLMRGTLEFTTWKVSSFAGRQSLYLSGWH
jgi:hypothetical protein